jgi:hypothetical protein
MLTAREARSGGDVSLTDFFRVTHAIDAESQLQPFVLDHDQDSILKWQQVVHRQ